MAISLAAAAFPQSLNGDHRTSSSTSTSISSKISCLSSLQFPRDLRLHRIGNLGFKSTMRPRGLPLVIVNLTQCYSSPIDRRKIIIIKLGFILFFKLFLFLVFGWAISILSVLVYSKIPSSPFLKFILH